MSETISEYRIENNKDYEIKYRKPKEMKDSGIEWLGKIPKDWEITKIKYSYNFSVGATPSSDDSSYYDFSGYRWVTIGDMKNKYIENTKTYISKKAIKETNIKINKKGSLLYSFKLSVGQVAFINNDMYTNEGIATFNSNNKNSLQFLFYIAPIFVIKNAKENIYGAKILNQKLINNANILFPIKYIEQQKIANFLDVKTAEFDNIIRKKEELIQKLEEAKKSLISEVVTGKVKIVDGELIPRKLEEMKDSGVEWLGKIPKDWELPKIKYYSKKITQGPNPKYSDEILSESNFKVLKTKDLYDKEIFYKDADNISYSIYKTCVNAKLEKNDFLIGIVGKGSIGKVNVFNSLDNKRYIFTRALGLIRLIKDKICSKYLYYFFRGNYGKEIINKGIIGSTGQEVLKTTYISNIKIPLPRINIQKTMIIFLDKKVKEIDTIIQKNKTYIEKLKEAKQSLISEAVTGKIDLRDWEIVEAGEEM